MSSFDEMFESAVPVFISPAVPSYSKEESAAPNPFQSQKAKFVNEIMQQEAIPALSSVLRLYTSISIEKLQSYLGAEDLERLLLSFRHKTLTKVGIYIETLYNPACWSENFRLIFSGERWWRISSWWWIQGCLRGQFPCRRQHDYYQREPCPEKLCRVFLKAYDKNGRPSLGIIWEWWKIIYSQLVFCQSSSCDNNLI